MSLLVQRRRVMNLEENLEKSLVCHFVRLKEYSNHFGMIRVLIANVVIVWILSVASCVANDRFLNSFDMSVY